MRRIWIFGLLLSLATGWGCTERMELELDPAAARLVVEGVLTTDTLAHRVRLTRSGDYFSNQPSPPVSGASVWVISSQGDSIAFHESDSLPGQYFSDPGFFGVAGQSYRLHISLLEPIQGLTDFNSEEEAIPLIGKIDSIGLKFQPDWGPKGFWEIKVWAQDPVTIDYYLFKALLNNRLVTDSIKEVFVSDDALFNGRPTNGITGQYYDLTKEDEVIEIGDTATFELNSVSRGYFNFIREIREEIFGNNPLFSGPPANATGNISGGAMGYFSAYSIARGSRIVSQKDFEHE